MQQNKKMLSFLQILKNLQESRTELSFTDHSYRDQDQNEANNYAQNSYNASQNLPGQNYIQYVPYKRKVTNLQQRVYTQRIPMVKQVYYQVERVVVQSVPVQRMETGYYAVEHLRYYQKQIVPQKSIEYVPVVRKVKRLQFLPVETKIVHYPKDVSVDFIEEQVEKSFVGHVMSTQDTSPEGSVLNAYPTKIVSITSSPIREFYPDFENENQSNYNVSSSILNSLSKAYSPEPSTDQEEYSCIPQTQFKNTITPFQYIKRRPSTLKQIKHKSAQTIDSNYVMKF